jgi:hypothetical protein
MERGLVSWRLGGRIDRATRLGASKISVGYLERRCGRADRILYRRGSGSISQRLKPEAPTDAGDSREGLEQTALGEGQAAVVSHDAMIQYPYIHKPERLAKSSRDQFVGLTRLGHTGRMIVGQDHRGRIAA